MRKIVAILSFVLLGVSLFAQNPGYMGRHVIFNMEGYLSPAWLKPTQISEALTAKGMKNSSVRYLSMNYILSPNVEVIVWKKGTVGAGYNYFKSPFDFKSNFSLEETAPLSPYDAYYNDVYVSGRADIVAHGFNVFYKQYIRKTMAPMGHYFKFTFDGFFYKYQGRSNDIDGLFISPEVLSQMKGKGMLFGLKAEYGYDYLLFDFLKLSMGVSVGATFGGYKAILQDSRSLPMTSFANSRVLGAYFFGIKLGVGFLTF